MEGFSQSIEELASDDLGEGFDGDEEGVFCRDPAMGGGVESPTGDHEMEMGMELKILIPGVQDGGEA